MLDYDDDMYLLMPIVYSLFTLYLLFILFYTGVILVGLILRIRRIRMRKALIARRSRICPAIEYMKVNEYPKPRRILRMRFRIARH